MKKLTILAIGAAVLFGLPVPEHVHDASPAGVETVKSSPSKLGEVLDLVSSSTAYARGWDGLHRPIGTISASTTTANITVPDGAYVVVQCPVAAYIGSGGTRTSATCTSTSCKYREANEPAYIDLRPGYTSVAVLLVTGTATCAVWDVP